MGRIYKSVKCWSYKQNKSPYPIIKCTLVNLIGEEIRDIELPIDTGFSGSILVPRTIFEHFKIAELPPDCRRIYSTLAGEIVMRVARGYVVINDVKLEVFIETPLFGYGKLLMGREVLNKLSVVLDGPKETCCLVRE